MNPRLRFLLARFVYIIVFILVNCTSGVAQPQYFASFSANGNITNYPLNSYVNKTQWVYPPYHFLLDGDSTKSAAPYGKINRLYIKLGGVVDTNNIYSEFTIKLGQHVGTDSSWATYNWDTTLQEVFYKSEFVITGSIYSWVSFDLPNTYIYDPSKSIVVEFSTTTGVGVPIQSISSSNSSALIGQSTADEGIRTDKNVANIGFDFEHWESNNAGIHKLIGPIIFCGGRYNIEVELVNNGRNPIDSVQINWSLDDTLKTPFWYSKTIDTFGSTKGNTVLLNLGSDTFPAGKQKRLIVWTNNPNSKTDSITSDDTLDVLLQPAMNGQYTLGDSTKDYQSFQALSFDLNEFGICGPVTITIDSGTYTDRLLLNKIPGTNSENTVLIQGTERTDCILQNKANSVHNQQTLLLNGTSHTTIKELTINVLDSNIGVGIQLINTAYIQIDHCNVNMIKTPKGDNLFGIAGIGARHNMFGTGYGGNHSSFFNNTIVGGTSSITYYGENGLPANLSSFRNNTLTDFKAYGMDLKNLEDLEVINNKISSRSNSGSIGLEVSSSSTLLINSNHISNCWRGLILSGINPYNSGGIPSLVSNNMIITPLTGLTGGDIVASSNLNIYHNSFSSSGASNFVLNRSDSCDIRSNIFNHTRGGIVFHVGDSGGLNASNTLDYNNYYSPVSTGNPNTIKIGSNTYRTVSDWFKADTVINRNSFYKRPGFLNNNDLHIDSTGNLSGPYLNISRDIDNDLRCSIFPTIGADQYTPQIFTDSLKPDVICTPGCLTYTLPPIKPFLNSNYATNWVIDSISVKTKAGYASKNWIFSSPSSTNGWIKFCPDSTEADSSFTLFLIYRDLTGAQCFTTFSAYIHVGDKPDASFTVSEKELCYGDNLLVQSKSKHLADSVIFEMGDGYQKANPTFKYVYDSYGVFNIQKSVYANGCSDSSQITVKVATAKGAKLVEGHPTKGKTRSGKLRDPDYLCTNDTTYYQVFPPKATNTSTCDSVWKVQWVSLKTLDGKSVQDTLTLLPDSMNTFRIRVFPSNQYLGDILILEARIASLIHNKCDTTLKRYIRLRKSPKVGFINTPFCLNEPVTFEDTTSNDPQIIDRFWNFHDGYTSTEVRDTHTFKSIGNQTVTLTNLSINGCHYYLEKTFQINPRSQVHFYTNDSCHKRTIQFTDNSKVFGKDHQYLWKFSDGSIQSGRQTSHSFDSSGTFITTLFITDSIGCKDSTVQESNILQTPQVNFRVLDSCLNSITIFQNETTDTNRVTYKWLLSKSDSSYDAHPQHTYGYHPTSPVMLVATNGGICSDTIFKKLSLHTVPNFKFTHQSSSPYVVQFTPTDSTDLSFTWYFGDGDSSSIVSPKHEYPPTTNTYKVDCIVTTLQRCRTSYSDTLTVGNQHLHGKMNLEFRLFPNPFNSEITIVLKEMPSDLIHITMSNILGQGQRFEASTQGKHLQISKLENLHTGVYTLTVQTLNKTYRYKVIKE
ncbi:MAG: T9SS type A sorting domain-containing protein [Bacteroidetes bacterium]|nr:T9SS type A sorting domain-containing protein [Bacteroidota bacterium]